MVCIAGVMICIAGVMVCIVGVYVKGIVHRPAVHGVMVYGQSLDKITCMAEVISHTRYQTYEKVENLLHVLEVGDKSVHTTVHSTCAVFTPLCCVHTTVHTIVLCSHHCAVFTPWFTPLCSVDTMVHTTVLWSHHCSHKVLPCSQHWKAW